MAHLALSFSLARFRYERSARSFVSCLLVHLSSSDCTIIDPSSIELGQREGKNYSMYSEGANIRLRSCKQPRQSERDTIKVIPATEALASRFSR